MPDMTVVVEKLNSAKILIIELAKIIPNSISMSCKNIWSKFNFTF